MDLLDDLDDLGDDFQEHIQENNVLEPRDDEYDESDAEDDLAAMEIEKYLMESIKSAQNIKSLVKIHSSAVLRDTLEKIRDIQELGQTSLQTFGAVEEDPEYQLILNANNFIVEIDNDLLIIHKFVRDHYAHRFPELESLLPRPIDYINAVQTIGNQVDDLSKLDLKTSCNLQQSAVMVITVAATTSIGRQLSDEELDRISEACKMFLELEEARETLMLYVEARMILVAPNLTALIGSSTAAKLMGAAGGLSALCKIPACNLQVLGKTAKTNTGLSALGIQKHVGFIFNSELVSNVPSDYRKKANRLVSAKCALAARIDVSGESPSGSAGLSLKQEVEKKIGKLLEPPAGQSLKALAVPLEPAKKRRGGKRARRMKEKYGISELRKLQNRMSFGVAEEEFGEETGEMEGLGMIGAANGKVRQVSEKKLKIGLTKKYQKLTGKIGSVSGLATSLSFTPVQGLELENPNAAKVEQANEKWFSKGFKKE